MGQNNTKWDKIQTITAVILASITIAGIVLSFGEAKNKLENLEIGQKNIKIELQEINSGLKNLQSSTYTKEDAERDFSIRDRIWEAKRQISQN
ncbi:MAG: hypothetical protein GPJ00_01155 [Microcystis aeruginosa W13-18]|nr:hypothetical protein [Microcystis aeruginosa W13-18]NCR34969.1 hypothetical protein [Microcystis aeruginosa S11-05]NCR48449.1 hypothetical protein [Microcystis aeruginosa S11-01]